MYTKVFRSIFDGSLYGHFEATITFLALLVLADKDGVVDMTEEKLAAACGYPIDIIKKGIDELLQPDPRSRTPDQDGRRITLLHDAGWGWTITNYTKYREIRSAEERREYFKLKKREQRANVHNVHRSPPLGTHTDAEAYAETTTTLSSKLDDAREILNFLNEKTGKKYPPVKSNIDLIAARLKEGYTIKQLHQVIVRKCSQWAADENMALYLRPKTLFNRTNMANYVGELVL